MALQANRFQTVAPTFTMRGHPGDAELWNVAPAWPLVIKVHGLWRWKPSRLARDLLSYYRRSSGSTARSGSRRRHLPSLALDVARTELRRPFAVRTWTGTRSGRFSVAFLAAQPGRACDPAIDAPPRRGGLCSSSAYAGARARPRRSRPHLTAHPTRRAAPRRRPPAPSVFSDGIEPRVPTTPSSMQYLRRTPSERAVRRRRGPRPSVRGRATRSAGSRAGPGRRRAKSASGAMASFLS